MPGIEKTSARLMQELLKSRAGETAARGAISLKEGLEQALERLGLGTEAQIGKALATRTGKTIKQGAAVQLSHLPVAQELQGQLVKQLGPLLEKVLPEAVQTQVADLLLHVNRGLGAGATPLTTAEARQFLSRVLLAELEEKVAARLQVATPEQVKELGRLAGILKRKLETAGPHLDKQALLQHPPPELVNFLAYYNRIGVESAAAINARLSRAGVPASVEAAVLKAARLQATARNGAQFLIDGPAAFAKMEELIRGAKSTIYLETYVWHDDATGKRMAELLIEMKRKNPQLDVRVLYDSLGQHSYPPDRQKVWLAEMAKHGIEVLQYNREVLSRTGINLSHRKLLLVDGHQGMTGGMNIGDNYAHGWHDTMVYLQGTCVGDLLKRFGGDWKKSGGRAIRIDPLPPGDYGSASVAVAITDPGLVRHGQQIKQASLAAIDAARPGQDIWVASPYFSDTQLVEHLLAAQQRGVQVNMLLPHGNDMPLFSDINGMMANRLLQAGAKGYLLDTGPKNVNFSHVKLLVVGEDWALMGSANNDIRSFAENQELSVAIRDAALIKDIRKRLIEVDVRRATPMQARPLAPHEALLDWIKEFL